MRLIDADALYEEARYLEAQAIDYTVKISNDKEKREEWLRWSAILAERSAFRHDVYDAPTIEPEPQWIPCSERLPEATGVYIVTCNIYSGDKVDGVTATWSYWRRNEWMMKDVLAWMPLPKPYGGEQDE